MDLLYEKLRDVKDLSYGTPGSAGIDFYVPRDFVEVSLAPGDMVKIPSGVRAAVPDGHALIAFNKSGVATKTGLIVGACVVDSDYRGEIHLHMINAGLDVALIRPDMKLCQFILLPYVHANLNLVAKIAVDTIRGAGGFGSTGH